MSYTSPANVRGLMRKLPSSITDPDIQTHIDRADALIDGMLGEVFAVPFSTTPKLIESVSNDLTVFFIAEDLFSSNTPNMDSYQEKRYTRAMEMLNKIGAGELYIGVAQKAGSESGFASTNDSDPVFTLDEPEW